MPAQLVQVGPSPADVLLRRPRHWALSLTCLLLAVAHFGAAAIQPPSGPRAILVTVLLGAILLLVAAGAWSARRELEISVTRRRVCQRRCIGPWHRQRTFDVDRIQAVRLTQVERHGRHYSRIALIADSEDLDCPTTSAPRQQALLLAMALHVRLIRIWNSTTPTAPEARIHELTGSA